MVQLSVVIITLNEEKNIRRCLSSVKDLADEIVVVDSYSSDSTEQICNEFSVRFIKQKFLGHIEQKNFALEQASNNYCLSLDADEEVTEELKQQILAIKASWKADAYQLSRLSSYCGKWIKHCGWYPDKKIRLFDKTKGKWKGINPHDRYEMESGATIASLKGDLLHYTFHTIDQHIEQINFFSTIAAQQAFKKGKRTNLPAILFRTWWKFFQSFVIRLGFLDGYYGYLVCKNSAHHTFLKYTTLKELQKSSKG